RPKADAADRTRARLRPARAEGVARDEVCVSARRARNALRPSKKHSAPSATDCPEPNPQVTSWLRGGSLPIKGWSWRQFLQLVESGHSLLWRTPQEILRFSSRPEPRRITQRTYCIDSLHRNHVRQKLIHVTVLCDCAADFLHDCSNGCR